MAEELLRVTNLSVSFRMYQGALTHTLVAGMHDVNLHLNCGEILAVVGASGSGKSLLAHAVLGILPYNAVTSGEMRYRGELLDAVLQEQLRGREMALIPQSVTYLDPLMRVGKEVCGLYGAPADMAATFRRLHLEERVERLYPFQLSGGMARRVLFSTAVITDASLIIADEPTPGMDVKSAVEALQLLRELADAGKGVLLITHDIDLAVEVADNVAVFYEGRTVDMAPAAAFHGDGAELVHPYTKALYHALPQNDFTVYTAAEVTQMTAAGGA
ncbi:ATP-binding cassette domain-containing protein [uncultured Selenomonas sp.]|uniref:ATP-binding cassette domain-containing protein n=1 Tax=uncultured Selenomonas sp. TaxID=159275 RepID=UPI0028E60987|nr:ATP-binding cassette domain-containing protein [uncultured Selenomonas sp.]